MNKRILLCVLLCCSLLLTMLAACNGNGATSDPAPPPEDGGEQAPAAPKTLYAVDFEDGKTDFIMVNSSYPTSDFSTTIEVKNADGESALAITAPGGGETRIGVNVDGLLGSRVTDVRVIVFDIYAEYPDGNFAAVGGKILAMSGDTSAFASNNWNVYMEAKNPNAGTLEFKAGEGFDAAGPNIVELSCLTNGSADKGEAPAVICIKSITFYDESYTGMEVDTSAGWAGPEGYGESAIANWELPVSGAVVSDDFFEFYTWGMDADTGGMSGPDGKNTVGTDDYLPWEIIHASYGIVIEMPEPEGNSAFVHFGAYNGWSWTQCEESKNEVRVSWADGKLTIMWNKLTPAKGFNPLLVTYDDWAAKFRVGSWDFNITELATGAYIIYDADAVPAS